MFHNQHMARSNGGHSCLNKLQMAVLAPIPSARVITAIAMKPGYFNSKRTA
jgi:hypothetical protein